MQDSRCRWLMTHSVNPILCWMLLSAISSLCGCHAAGKHQLAAIANFESCAPRQAIADFDEALEGSRAESEILTIDRAIARLMAGEVRKSESELETVRKQIDFLRQKDLVEQTRSALSDDTAVSWSGREFERRMIDNIVLTASLLGDGQDAVAYSHQAMDALHGDFVALQSDVADDSDVLNVGHSIEENHGVSDPPLRLSANAFSAYLQAIVASHSSLNSDVTDRAIHQAAYWNVGNSPFTAALGTQTKKGHGTLHVITFAGRVTDWTEETAAPTSAALLIADQIVSAVGDHTVPPTVAPVVIAKPKLCESEHPFLTVVEVIDPREKAGQLFRSQTVVDLNQAAWDSYENDRDQQIARAVARRIVKKAAIYAAKNQLSGNSDSGGDLVMYLGGMAWEAFEKPDFRHIDVLPERVEAVQIELTEGAHRIRMQAKSKHMKTVVEDDLVDQLLDVQIENGRNTIVLCFRPSDQSRKMVVVQQ